MLIGCATAASLFPFVGTIVYMIVRPPEFLDDVRERELEMQAAEARLAELGYHLCPHCDYEVEKEFLRCPNCLRKLKDPCKTCGKPLDPMWKICPFCESEVGGGITPRRVRRRVSAADGAAGTAAGVAERSTSDGLSERPVSGGLSERPVPSRLSERPASGGLSERPVPGRLSERPASGGLSDPPTSGRLTERPISGGLSERPTTATPAERRSPTT
jgi:hypothetical protein